jgi:hypothetical protein
MKFSRKLSGDFRNFPQAIFTKIWKRNFFVSTVIIISLSTDTMFDIVNNIATALQTGYPTIRGIQDRCVDFKRWSRWLVEALEKRKPYLTTDQAPIGRCITAPLHEMPPQIDAGTARGQKKNRQRPKFCTNVGTWFLQGIRLESALVRNRLSGTGSSFLWQVLATRGRANSRKQSDSWGEPWIFIQAYCTVYIHTA